jgi:hypothetical protein
MVPTGFLPTVLAELGPVVMAVMAPLLREVKAARAARAVPVALPRLLPLPQAVLEARAAPEPRRVAAGASALPLSYSAPGLGVVARAAPAGLGAMAPAVMAVQEAQATAAPAATFP